MKGGPARPVGLAHVLSGEEERLVVKPAVDRFNKQYRSQYKSEFAAGDGQSLDTSATSAGKGAQPKEVFGQFKTIKNLVQGLLQSSKELKSARKLSAEEYSVHVLKFMVDNNQFRSECFRHAVLEGHVRDYESMAYHFDFRPYMEGQRSPVLDVVVEQASPQPMSGMPNVHAPPFEPKCGLKMDDPADEYEPAAECSLDDALLAYANLTLCKLILDQAALQGIQKVSKLDNQIQHFARQSMNQSRGQDLSNEQRLLLVEFSKNCIKPTLAEIISVSIISHLIDRKIMVPERPPAAAITQKQ